MAALGLVKIRVFWNKEYDAIISSMMSSITFYQVTWIIL